MGACEKCTGLGTFMRVDEERILPNRDLSIREGAVKASGWYYAEGSVAEMYYLGLGKKYGFTLDTPIKEMSTEAVNALLYGTNEEKIEMHRTNEFGSGVYYNTFEGIVENLERRFRETNSEWMKEEIGSFMSGVECPDCHGKRLKPVVLAVTIGGKNISDFCEMSIRDELKFIADNEPNLTEKQKQIGGQIMKEIKNRLQFLQSVGLDYLTLARSAGTLSGGESQRIRLTTQIGSALSGVLYVLDEPSIGLHQRDNDKLIATLKNLRDLGNTVIVVEHDEDTMRSADYIVDVGPGAGVHGGEIVAAGSVKDICKAKRSITGDYLSGRKRIEVPQTRRPHLKKIAGGWPHYFYYFPQPSKERITTAAYYDVANFARLITAPGWFSWGYNDEVCPPTSMYAAYNIITAKKELHPYLETGHYLYQEQSDEWNKWLCRQLGL